MKKSIRKTLGVWLLLSLFSNTTSAQEGIEILSGKPIGGKYELLSFTGTFDPFALGYFMMLDYKTQYLGHALEADHYFISTSRQAGVFGVNENLEITYSYIIETPSTLEEGYFLEASLFSEKMLFFYEAKEEKQNRGLHCVTLDLYDMAFSEPVFLEHYVSKTHLELHIEKSPDNKLLTLLVNPNTAIKKTKVFHLLQLNESLHEVLNLVNQDATFSEVHNFDQWAVSTSGDVTLIYAQNAGIYSHGGIEKPAENIGLIRVRSGVPKKELIELEGRKILDCSVIPGTENSELFISWYYTSQYYKNGFSTFHLNGDGEALAVDFEPNWAEPFTQLDGNYYRDQQICNQQNARLMNAPYSLVALQKHSDWTTYVIEKKTDLRFFAADYGKTILAIDNSNTTTTYNSDLFLVRTNKSGEMTEAAKIERGLFHGIFPGNVITFSEKNKMHILYCTLANTNYSEVSDNYKGIAGNYQINIAEVDLSGDEINLTKRTINQFNTSKKMTQFVPFLQTASGEIDNFTTLAFTEAGFRMLRIVY